MTNSKIITDNLLSLTKELFHQCYKGNLDLWFSYLTKDSMYLGSGNPILFGDTAIKTHFKNLIGYYGGEIIHEEYFVKKLSKSIYTVNGKISLKGDKSLYTATNYFTIIYKIENNNITILQQHNSYEYHDNSLDSNSLLRSSKGTLAFINDVLLHNNENNKVQIQASGQCQFVDPNIILYIQGVEKKTEFICLDRILTSNHTLKDLIQKLPKSFYQIHRSYIVNTNYIVAIRRFEVELLNGIKLPIPEKVYTKIKSDLKYILSN